MDYGTLKTNIAAYLHRDDLTATIPTFVTLAQARINHDINVTSQQTTTTLTVTAGTKEVTLPSDFLELLSLRIPYNGGVRELQQASLAQNSRTLQSAGGASDTPFYYSRYGSILELTPIPAQDTTLTLVYKKRLAAFSDDTDTDDLLTNFPNIYLYASLSEASAFLMDGAAAGFWKGAYDEELVRINDLAYKEEWSGAPKQIISLGTETP